MMDLVLYAELLQNENQRRDLNLKRRVLRDRSDPLSLPEATFKGLFRISRELGHWLLNQIGPHMRDLERNTGIPKALRFFASLHFLCEGSYQRGIGQDYLTSMHQSSVSRCLAEVTDLMVEVLGYIIKFPETEEEKNQEKQLFMEMYEGFPGIVGCIDCTQIAIIAPKTEDPEMPGMIFYCRKQYYSLNVQIVCNAKLKILNINARFPGSVHDSAIWQTSLVRSHLANNFRENRNQMTYLLGDSGYPLEPWLLTPIANPLINNEREYNRRHKSIRNTVERTNGVLKQRFRCCLKHRTLHYSPQRAAKIIYSCAIVHNLCIDRNENLNGCTNFNSRENNLLNSFFLDYDKKKDQDEENDNEHVVQDGDNLDPIQRNCLQEGRTVRNRVVENYFV